MRKIISKYPLNRKLINLSCVLFSIAPCTLVAGCSISYPLAGLIDAGPTASLKTSPVLGKPAAPLNIMADIDTTPTGSITPVKDLPLVQPKPLDNNAKTAAMLHNSGGASGVAALSLSPLAVHLQASDMVAAHSALNIALEPKNTPQSVAWSNPMTGANGAFMAKGSVISQGESACRNFQAFVRASTNDTVKKLNGAACQDAYGQWIIKTLDPAPQATLISTGPSRI